MKKTLIKIGAFVLTFLVTVFVGIRIMNTGHNNMTMEMADASFPVVYMSSQGNTYNQLFGYAGESDTAFQRDTITVLGEGRNTDFNVLSYGREVSGVSIEVRNIEGTRLIENTPVTDLEYTKTGVRGTITLKDLIDRDTEYSLAIILTLDEEQEICYYTRVIWSDNLYLAEKMDFVKDFHNRLYDKEQAKEITKYLEPNSQLADNTTFHTVNIHSSFKQITWGDMAVQEVETPTIQLTDIQGQTASFLLHYYVYTKEGKVNTYYRVQEYFRVRYTSDRMYLLDYERTTSQIPQESHLYANDKILLGIVDDDVDVRESEDGNIIVFQEAGRLFSYNLSGNKLTTIFSFYDDKHRDERYMNDNHGLKILDIDEGGNVKFAVYGYMNRGRHEGEVGIEIYTFNSSLNTVEEEVYVPYSKTYAVLKQEMDKLLYLNRNQKLYFFLEDTVYGVDLTERTYREVVNVTQDDSLQVSANHKIMVWQEGEDIYDCQTLQIRNLNNETQQKIQVNAAETILPLGFMEEDVVYGIAYKADVVYESSGSVIFPMYKVCIADSDGNILKEYAQSGIYVVGCSIEDNQITLQRVTRTENGAYQTATDDQIMDNSEPETVKNKVVTVNTDVYERYLQIQMKGTIDSKSIKLLNPKEVVFEGGRNLTLDLTGEKERYYVYTPYGVAGIYSLAAKAVNLAYDMSGSVVNQNGSLIWLKGNRVSKNQIMAIKEASVTENETSLSVCLDTILNFEGLVRDSSYLLAQGQTAKGILESSLENTTILDLTGCNLDSVLYYVNQDIPVLALLDNGEAVLVTGFNEFNVVIMEPSTGTLYKKGMNDSAQWFQENGNHFITYIRTE